MSIVSTIPPRFDCEVCNDVSKHKLKELLSRYINDRLSLRDVHESYIAFVSVFCYYNYQGLSKGSIVFI